MKLSSLQIEYFKERALSPEEVERQIDLFKKGTQYLNLAYSASLEKGITQIREEQIQKIESDYSNLISDKTICKFVPASGAATRMFKDLYAYLESNEDSNFVKYFIENISRFAFYEDLKRALLNDGYKIENLLLKKDYTTIIDYLLSEKGLNYGSLPKGLLTFHKTEDITVTPIAEHIKEAVAYAGKNSKLIFTISQEFQTKFEKEIEHSFKRYGIKDISYDLTYQKPETDTVAVDENYNLIPLNDKEILLRPGGHGSLIANLNEVEADIVFIKNIDNVCATPYIETTVKYKKVLLGILLEVQNKIFEYVRKIENYDGSNLEMNTELEDFIEKKLNISVDKMQDLNSTEKVKFYKSKLNRPIRVCGMVRNEGEPGGGPFGVLGKDGVISLQIVESSQINHQDKLQEQIFLNSSYFNPVDIVCSLTNAKGKKYDLTKFVDKEAYFIAKKSFKGKEILALEHPGLWNGGMGDWNTIFVEVPSLTFNPVKTINDLLRETHQS